jgi:hypothetical protein
MEKRSMVILIVIVAFLAVAVAMWGLPHKQPDGLKPTATPSETATSIANETATPAKTVTSIANETATPAKTATSIANETATPAKTATSIANETATSHV